MANGPLIPGLREFDAPRRRPPGWLIGGVVAVVVLALLVVFAGLFAGAGPLRSLGLVTTSLAPVSYRPTATGDVIQVSVAMPPSGLCRDDEIVVTAFERGNRIEVEASVTRPRRGSCTSSAVGGDLHWVDVGLDAALGERQVVRAGDHTAVPRDSG